MKAEAILLKAVHDAKYDIPIIGRVSHINNGTPSNGQLRFRLGDTEHVPEDGRMCTKDALMNAILCCFGTKHEIAVVEP